MLSSESEEKAWASVLGKPVAIGNVLCSKCCLLVYRSKGVETNNEPRPNSLSTITKIFFRSVVGQKVDETHCLVLSSSDESIKLDYSSADDHSYTLQMFNPA